MAGLSQVLIVRKFGPGGTSTYLAKYDMNLKICSDNFEIILARLGLSSIAGNAPPIRQIFEEVFKTEQQQYWQLSIASVKSPVSSNLGCCQFV